MKVQPSTVFQAIRGKSLAETLSQITQRSGIIFKIDTDLHQDVVSQSIDADNWSRAVRSLLANYNFVTIQKSNTIKTVIISSRNNDVADPVITSTPVASAEYVIEIEPPLTVMEMEHERSDEYY
jgi:hypothetical protein